MTEQTTEQERSIDTATGEKAPAEISSTRVKKIFTDIAWNYERFNFWSSFGRYRSWLRKLIEYAPIRPDSLMLDVAGGTGDVTFTACKHKKPGAVILSDYTPAMLDVAQARLDAGEANGVPVELCVVDGQDIHCDDETFDVLTMSYGIRNMPERERALSEMYRVLKHGGALCVLEFSTPPNELMKLGYRLYLRYGIPTWGKLITGDASGFVYLANSISAFPDQEGFARMLREAGFDRVEYHNVTFGVAAIHIAYKD
jgi:demethylmenaquinone methyltransferase/2-methoxy-6-polyprenyl-1,4-benzoquinol methylase